MVQTSGLTGYSQLLLMPDVSHLGGLLKAGRTRRGLSQEAVARRVGYSLKQYNRLENGHVGRPTARRLGRLAQVLGMPIADLYRAAGWMTPVGNQDERRVLDELWPFIPDDVRSALVAMARAAARVPPADPPNGENEPR